MTDQPTPTVPSSEPKENSIFLSDPSIVPWEGMYEPPVPEGVKPKAFTRLVSWKGYGDWNEEIGPYRVACSYIAFIADIVRRDYDRDFTVGEVDLDSLANQELLHQGSIAIYREGIVPGTDFYGQEQVYSGRIWVGTPIPLEGDSRIPLAMYALGETRDKERVLRLERVIAGFELLERTYGILERMQR